MVSKRAGLLASDADQADQPLLVPQRCKQQAAKTSGAADIPRPRPSPQLGLAVGNFYNLTAANQFEQRISGDWSRERSLQRRIRLGTDRCERDQLDYIVDDANDSG